MVSPLFLSFSFIESYRFYHFKSHLSNRFYQASINRLPLSVPNENVHLSTSAGVCYRQDPPFKCLLPTGPGLVLFNILFYFHNFVFCQNSIRTGVAKLKLDSKNDQKNYDVLHPLTFTFPCLNILSKFTDDEMFDENRQINKHSDMLQKCKLTLPYHTGQLGGVPTIWNEA